MDQLFDSLSEDWVSQPHSPQSEQARWSSPVASSPGQLSNPSQSRIPRFRPRTSSRLSTDNTPSARRVFSKASDKPTKEALREKSSSNLNSSSNNLRRKTTLQSESRKPKIDRALSDPPVKASSSYIPEETVQHKLSPVKLHEKVVTPEWKRRLGGNAKSGDRPDLFSPIGLQNVFKPPTVKSAVTHRRRNKHQSLAVGEVPYSPPLHPIKTHPLSAAQKDNSEKEATKSDPPVEVRKEVQETTHHSGSELGIITVGKRETRGGPWSIFIQVEKEDQYRNASDEHHSDHEDVKPPPSKSRRSSPYKPIEMNDDLDGSIRAPSERSRVTSGQMEDYDEGLSPFFVSRQQTIDGKIDYAAVVDREQIYHQMQDLARQRKTRLTSLSSVQRVNCTDGSSPPTVMSQRFPSSDLTSHSLPEDLSTGTESFMVNGGFVNSRRGGRSQEGSFMRKPLSPSTPPPAQLERPSIANTARRKSTGSVPESLSTDAQKATSPSTPMSKHAHDPSSEERPRSSGSPLKLFGLYDTYTNEHLVRRMSRFEETMPESLRNEHDLKNDPDGLNVDDSENATRASVAFHNHRPEENGERNNSRLSSFGEGELNHFLFRSRHSLSLSEGRELRKDLEKPPQTPRQFRFVRTVGESSDKVLDSISRRKRKKHTSRSTQASDDTHEWAESEERPEIRDARDDRSQEVVWTAHGKRLPYSPVKDPQAKRRRTLLEAELSIGLVASPSHSEVKEAAAKSILGKKRKDALYDNQTQLADPGVLASRHILRPRNPTPSQSRQIGLNGVPQSNTYVSRVQEHDDNELHRQDGSAPSVDAPTEKLAEELASLALNVAQDMSSDIRKPSVTTADFFNEAQQIMQLIRARGRAPSSHITEEDGPEAEYQDDDYDSKLLDSTKDEFSRPPSREGGSLRKVREPARMDARVLSQLRKFEDNDEVGMALSSSLQSLKVPKSLEHLETTDLRAVLKQDGAPPESDGNTRILERVVGTQKRKHSAATEDPSPTSHLQPQSIGSHSTSGPSTTRSIPTNSSRGSRNKATIAPEKVAHLLSDQVAGMTFDHEKQIWVKSRNSSKVESSSKKYSASSDITDDDLLGAIPDLSVDEIEELRRMKVADYPSKSLASASDHVSNHDHANIDEQPRLFSGNKGISSSRLHTADGQQTRVEEMSSAPSRYSNLAVSGPVPETRATSWGDEVFGRKQAGMRSTLQKTQGVEETEHLEEVEHEISILEGRVIQTPDRKAYRKPRVVTVAFSSPLVDEIDASLLDQSDSRFLENDDQSVPEESPVPEVKERRVISSARKPSKSVRRVSMYQSASRRASTAHQSFTARPMSRLDEHEELSIVHCCKNAGMSIALSTPPKSYSLAIPPHSGQASSTSFQLSPLADFTVHQIDRPLDRSMVAGGRGMQIWNRPETEISISTQEIVKKITDVEPYEPYWEYLRAIDLRNRHMLTLHMLNDFCARLEELDVSDNQLSELNGAPSSLRYLDVCRNRLSNLSAWGHLSNLQYLNVSGNQLTILRGFQSLVHLRELKADDNEIESIEGVFALDGLMKLSLKRNRVRWVDFEDTNL